MAAVKRCGTQCSEYNVTSACFSVVGALDLARNREEETGHGEGEALNSRSLKKLVNSLHIPAPT